MLILKNLIFVLTLIYAGYYDYKNRIVFDRIHLIIIGASLLSNFDLGKSIEGLILLPIPLIIVALLNENSIGGGDIKIVSAIGFFLEFQKGAISLIIAFFLFAIFSLVILKKGIKETFPLVPFITVGCIVILRLYKCVL